jgi:GNAT superfamily N-acetyltransferase
MEERFPIPIRSCSEHFPSVRAAFLPRFGLEIGMDAEDDTREGFGRFSHVPPEYFVDRKGREHIFRFAGARDFGKVLEMYRRFEPKQGNLGVPPEDPIRLEPWVAHFFTEGIGNLVAMDPDDSIVGHAAILPITANVSEYFMAVLPLDRSAGIGGILAQVVIEAARYLGVGRLWICVDKTNIGVLHLHQKLGFEIREGRWGYDYEMIYAVDRAAADMYHNREL